MSLEEIVSRIAELKKNVSEKLKILNQIQQNMIYEQKIFLSIMGNGYQGTIGAYFNSIIQSLEKSIQSLIVAMEDLDSYENSLRSLLNE